MFAAFVAPRKLGFVCVDSLRQQNAPCDNFERMKIMCAETAKNTSDEAQLSSKIFGEKKKIACDKSHTVQHSLGNY